MKKLIIYGCGTAGKRILPIIQFKKSFQVIAYIDKSVQENAIDAFYLGIRILPPEYMKRLDYDYILIASMTEKYVEEMRETLKKNNVHDSKIINLNMFMSRFVIYGCGEIGKEALTWFVPNSDYVRRIVAYIDQKARKEPNLNYMGIPVLTPESIVETEYDYILIATTKTEYALEMRQTLAQYRIPDTKIIDLSLMGYRDIRYYFIQRFAEYANHEKIEGNVAECGVNCGDSAMYLNLFFIDRKLYLFDTFEGFPDSDLNYERNLENENFLRGVFNQECFKSADPDKKIETVKRKMTYPENVIIRKGYFPDAASDIDDIFCFVNLDMDLYKPTLDGLRFFWDKIIPDGGIMLHDYFHPELPGVKKAVIDFESELGVKLCKTPIGDGCSIFVIKQ